MLEQASSRSRAVEGCRAEHLGYSSMAARCCCEPLTTQRRRQHLLPASSQPATLDPFVNALHTSAPPFFERLKTRLRTVPSKVMEAPGMRLKEAAVLAPLFWRDDEPWAYLTMRPMTLRKHPGQISFPGGAKDVGDVTPLHTALRETKEELGLNPDDVDVLGMLGAMPTITSFWVTPFVGVVPAEAPITANEVEIAEVLEAPLWRLRKESRFIYQADREVYVWGDGRHVVWGATFRMLHQLMEHVAAVGR